MSNAPMAPDHRLTAGRFFDDFHSITLSNAVEHVAAWSERDVSHREVAAILKREGFTRQGYAGAGAERTPRFTRLRATRQQLDAAHPNRHLPKGSPHA